MRIRVKSEGHNFTLVFPTRLLTSKFAMRMAEKYGRKYAYEAMKNIPPHALESLCAELRRVKAKHGTWELVDVVSADGDEVYISL